MSAPALPAPRPASAAHHGREQRLQARIQANAKHAAMGTLPAGMVAAMLSAVAVCVILWPRIPHGPLMLWFLARTLIAAARYLHARDYLSGKKTLDARAMRTYVILSGVDGALWGALGWALTPLFDLEVSVVTISMLCAIACMGALVMSMDMAAAMAFCVPISVPNAFYAALGRQDDLGYFCAVAILGLTAALAEAARANNVRTRELMRLRIESEMAHEAKTEALEQARLLSQARSRFIATMSHEMRTPLHGMLGMVGLIKNDHEDRRLDVIQRSGEHLLQVINDVLDFSRSESGGLPVHTQDFCVHKVLLDAADMVRAQATQKGLQLEAQIRLDPDEWVQGDPMRLRQVVLNLLGNAIKFTPTGTVRLHACRDNATGHLRVTVSDTGIGIPEHDLERIFEPFHQADGTYERRFGGTGLGLTISRDLCRAMGGTIECHSVLGQGSTFTCQWPFPAVRPPATALPIPSGAPHRSEGNPLAGLRVLMVEDNPVNAIVIKAMLEQLDITAEVLDNGEAALAWLQDHPVDLILMDCEMPGIDGMETTRRWRVQERTLGQAARPVIALTANGPDVFEEQGRPAGMDAYLAKPFTLEALSACLWQESQRVRVTAAQ